MAPPSLFLNIPTFLHYTRNNHAKRYWSFMLLPVIFLNAPFYPKTAVSKHQSQLILEIFVIFKLIAEVRPHPHYEQQKRIKTY